MTLFASTMESLRPLLSVGWLPAAVACAGAFAGLIADMVGVQRWGLRLITIGLGGATLLAFATAILPLGAAAPLVGSTFGLVLTGGAFAGLAAAVYFTAFLSCGTGLLTVRPQTRIPVGALIAIGAATGQILLGADDAVVMFVALELLALVAYALVAASANDRSDEAAARYFVQGSAATGLAVLGLAVLVGLAAGESSYAGLAVATSAMAPGAALLGGMLLVSALLFKVGAFPFHSWVPDAYETAPHGVAAFLAAGAKAAALGGFVVLYVRIMGAEPFLAVAAALRVMSVASIIFGNLVALKQTSVARMLGYSAVAQAGYALVGLSVSPAETLMFAATYAMSAATAFLVLEYFASAERGWDGSISGLAGFASKHPAASFALMVSLLSMTGIPLTVGFWGKFFVFYAAAQSGLLWLALVGLVGSVVSFGYYGRVIRALYVDTAVLSEVTVAEDIPASIDTAPKWPSLVGAAAILIAGVAPLIFGLSLVYALFRLS